MQFLGEDLYFGTGDGGSGGDPPNNAQNKDVLLGKLLRIDPRAAGRQALHGPAVEPVRRRRRPRRDLQLRPAQPVPLLLRLGTTRANRGSRSATSARTTSRRSTTRRSPPPAGPTSAGTRSRAARPTTEEDSRHARPRRHDQADLRLPPLPRRQLLGDRRLRRRRPAPCPPSAAATSTPTTARASSAPSPRTSPRQRRPQARPRRRLPTSFGEDDAHHLYVASQNGPVYRLVQK